MLDKTLRGADYTGLGDYYLVGMENNKLLVIFSIGEHQQFILVDLQKTTTGILINVALPNLLKRLAEAEDVTEAATKSPAKKNKTAKPRKQSALQTFVDKFTRGMYSL